MKIGTKSLLFGSHQFLLHPIFVALAWRRLYGRWPRRWWREWRVFVCFVVHDWGYWGLGDMDGPTGKAHPERGARLAARLCARGSRRGESSRDFWYEFTACHSRYYADILGLPPSPLMRADKYATVLYPRALYALLLWLSGEWREYAAYHESVTGEGSRGCWDYTGVLQRHWAHFAPGGGGEG